MVPKLWVMQSLEFLKIFRTSSIFNKIKKLTIIYAINFFINTLSKIPHRIVINKANCIISDALAASVKNFQTVFGTLALEND